MCSLQKQLWGFSSLNILTLKFLHSEGICGFGLDCLSVQSQPGAVWGDECDPGADLISVVSLMTFKPAPGEEGLNTGDKRREVFLQNLCGGCCMDAHLWWSHSSVDLCGDRVLTGPTLPLSLGYAQFAEGRQNVTFVWLQFSLALLRSATQTLTLKPLTIPVQKHWLMNFQLRTV